MYIHYNSFSIAVSNLLADKGCCAKYNSSLRKSVSNLEAIHGISVSKVLYIHYIH
jgi:hypothetical protein